MLGGGGRKMLSLAGARADIVAVNVNLAGGHIDVSVGPDATAARTDEKIAWIRSAAADRGGADMSSKPRGARRGYIVRNKINPAALRRGGKCGW